MKGDKGQSKGFKKDKRGGEAPVVQDERFSSMLSAPIFKKTSNQQNKVVLDDRFRSVLTDERFRTAPGNAVDKYGRKKKHAVEDQFAAKELEQFYKVDESQATEASAKGSKKPKESGKAEDRLDYLTKLARGEVYMSSDDSDASSEADDSSSSSDEDEEEEAEEAKKGPLELVDEDDVEYGAESTRRLAVLNCDWEHLKATDIMMVLQSFCPPGRSVTKVTIYPSDFGLERMADEERFGPQTIWKPKQHEEEEQEEQEEEASEYDDEEDDEDGEDIYDQIDYLGSDSDQSEGEDQDEEDDQDEDEDHGKKAGDLHRRDGAVGLVFHDEAKVKKYKKQKSSDIDEVALREYELSKLKYYFAIVECDSVDTSNTLYEECDGIELENSAMTFDLRFVPDEENFGKRQVRETCTTLPAQYTPPDFIINALQHTKVQCSWDEGEKEREKKLTNISQWRQLQESDFMQYMASDNSSDDEDSEEDDDDKKAKGSSLRKLLLGANAEMSDSEGSDASGSQGSQQEDDFFMDDQEESEEEEEVKPTKKDKKGKKKGSEAEEEGDEDMVMTYMPDAEKELQQKRKTDGMTPFELDQLKQTQKKKARKDMRKATIEAHKAEQEAERLERLEEAKKLIEKSKMQSLAHIDDEDEDGQLVVKDKKSRKLMMKSKTKRRMLKEQQAAGGAVEDDDEEHTSKKSKKGEDGFKVNTHDDRFAALFEGDANFGIDTTSSEYKATPGVQQILQEQRKRRQHRDRSSKTSGKPVAEEVSHKGPDVDQLVDRLKRKFQG